VKFNSIWGKFKGYRQRYRRSDAVEAVLGFVKNASNNMTITATSLIDFHRKAAVEEKIFAAF
jgi:hypothetical protein